MLLSDDDIQAIMLPFHLALLTHSQQHKALGWDFPCHPFPQPRSVRQICFQIGSDVYQVPHPWALHKQWNPKIAFQHSLIKTSIKQQQGLPEPPDPSYCFGISLVWQSALLELQHHASWCWVLELFLFQKRKVFLHAGWQSPVSSVTHNIHLNLYGQLPSEKVLNCLSAIHQPGQISQAIQVPPNKIDPDTFFQPGPWVASLLQVNLQCINVGNSLYDFPGDKEGK